MYTQDGKSNGKLTSLVVNGNWTCGSPERSISPLVTMASRPTNTKDKGKIDPDLKGRPKTIKCIKTNIGHKLVDMSISNINGGFVPTTMKIKPKLYDIISNLSIVVWKNHYQKQQAS